MAIGGERAAVQNPFIRYADEAGWTYLPPDEALRMRRGEDGLALHEVAEALDQLRRYHREGPELTALLQIQALTHLVHFYYGPTWNLSGKALFNWKDEAAGEYETLVKYFVQPRRLLRVPTDYICSGLGRLTFDTDLLYQPAHFRAEAIVHELLHLKVPNHGKLFRSLLHSHLSRR
ncbi:MAG: hypothetical protein BMS9Abin28_1372 [Anaerolineae bacterium]|nr:MAG: hypothetical protein BMS9Abin28_1372 [Anaerolineae bacterium]